MKKCFIEVSQEWLKEKMNLPKEAVVFGVGSDNNRDTFKFYIANYGKETPEGALIERREIQHEVYAEEKST